MVRRNLGWAWMLAAAMMLAMVLPVAILPAAARAQYGLPSGGASPTEGYRPAAVPSRDVGGAPAAAIPAGYVPAGALPPGYVPAGYVPAGYVPAGQVPTGYVPAAMMPQPGMIQPPGQMPQPYAMPGTLPGAMPAGQVVPALANTAAAAPAGYSQPRVIYVPAPQGGPGYDAGAVMPAQYTMPTAIPAGVPTAPPTGIAGCFAGLCTVAAKIKACYCKSPLGQMATTMISPLSGLTGGIIPSCCSNCAGDSPADKIKQDAANAAARRAAVKYLGTVDCHWYPEAELGLIGALRADRNECVRWEAAHQLGRGCCCTPKTIEALKICVEASNRDGNPSENSCRVRAEAYGSLQVCLGCGTDGADAVRPEMPARPENPATAAATAELIPYIHAVGYYRHDGFEQAREQIMAEARDVCSRVRVTRTTSQPERGSRSLMGIWAYAGRPQESGEQPTPAGDELRPLPEGALAQPAAVPTGNVPGYSAEAPPIAASRPIHAAETALVRPFPGASLYPGVEVTPPAAGPAGQGPVYQAELPRNTSRLPAMR